MDTFARARVLLTRFVYCAFLVATVTTTICTGRDAAMADPRIQVDPNQAGAPAGYKWFLIRDPYYVYVGRAESAHLGSELGTTFQPDELIFAYGKDGSIRRRAPRYAGEVSRILLSSSFTPDAALVRSTARRPDVQSTSHLARPRLTPESVPAGAPPGSRAYAIILPGTVLNGTVEQIKFNHGALLIAGHELTARASTRNGEVSHIIVPPNVQVPPELEASDTPQ